MSRAVIRLWPELAGPVIRPDVYGHFAEHLGRCVYEGIWVEPGSLIPNEGGLRLDVLAALKQLRAPVVRWPGGCFADTYHWRDGIGPPKHRPQTVNVWWKQVEPNTFGTNEFLRFCRAVGCAPYICLNVGSGSPREAAEWVEYCNFAGDSALARLRASHGCPEPYGVRYWGVGNENWGCGGRMQARDYAREYVRYATYVRALDAEGQLIACGHNIGDWNHDFCEKMRQADLIDHLSIHRYFHRGSGSQFSDSEYCALFADLLAMERDIQQADRLLGYFYPDKFVGLVVDEWGVWHPSATVENGLEQEHTLRDGVFAGACLNLLNRYASRITMANIAQTMNVLQCMAVTESERMFVTPTYHVFDMMRPHMGARLVRQEADCPEYVAHAEGLHKKMDVPVLSVSASLAGKRLLVTVANQTVDQDIETSIRVVGIDPSGATGRILHSKDPRDVNSFDFPKTVAPKRMKMELVGREVAAMFPAHSFAAVSIALE